VAPFKNAGIGGGSVVMLARLFLRHSVIYILIGIGLGIYMASSHDYVLRPVHTHLNLLGFVAMAICGFFYRLYPAAADDPLAIWHFWIANIAVVGLMIALAALLLGVAQAEIVTAVFSFVVFGGMILFAIIVFRATAQDA
jgi:hypothetical protein